MRGGALLSGSGLIEGTGMPRRHAVERHREMIGQHTLRAVNEALPRLAQATRNRQDNVWKIQSLRDSLRCQGLPIAIRYPIEMD